jgi:DNA-binding NtrC family response regulator
MKRSTVRFNPDPGKKSRRKKILVIDKPALINQIRKVLKADNGDEYLVTGTKTVPGALRLLNRKLSYYDLVLLDLQNHKTPPSSGKNIINHRAGCPVVLLTQMNDPKVIINALKMGCVGFIKKPVKSNRFLFRIKEILSEIDHKQ